jgi:ubiquitin-like 1-activating enzyme E1 B
VSVVLSVVKASFRQRPCELHAWPPSKQQQAPLAQLTRESKKNTTEHGATMPDPDIAAEAVPAVPACRGVAGAAAALDALYGPGAAAAVGSAKVLVVGAGGVGCELVKNLGCAGFASVTLVDLDTIDVSNLNRQFLFRRKHVGASKADIAAAAVEAMIPGFKVRGIVGNVKDARFDVSYFRDFDVVCNALDNLEARRHVNRMCLAAGVVLIESGSTGYNGQVTVIGEGKECYDCNPKPVAKTYAVCTIRSTPDKPVHCVVWAKHLWDLVFGADDESNVLRDLDGGGAGGDQGDQPSHSSPAAANADTSRMTGSDADTTLADKIDLAPSAADEAGAEADAGDASPADGIPKAKAKRVRFEQCEDPEVFAVRVCERVFKDDIEDQIRMKSLWEKEGRVPPTTYDVAAAAKSAPVNLVTLNLLEPRVWTREESAAVFKATLVHVAQNRAPEIGSLAFDKDDADALAFVIAASNLRAAAYGVEMQSPFAVKGIAGNIVHAIATTNAMVAGLIVLEAIKVVAHKDLGKSLTTFVRKTPAGNPGRRRPLLCAESLSDPNPNCYVCAKGMLPLSIDVETSTLKMFIEYVCKRTLGAVEPTVNVTSGDYYNTLYESGQGLEDDEVAMYESNLSKTLNELRVQTGSEVSIDDTMQSFSCSVVVTHVSKLLVDERGPGERFELGGTIPETKALDPVDAGAAEEDGAERAVDESDAIVAEVVGNSEHADAEAVVTGTKRVLENDEVAVAVEPVAKRQRSGGNDATENESEAASDDVVVID